MLFNSYTFIFYFLPLVWLGFAALLQRDHREGAIRWLVLASLGFYAWWNPLYLWLLGGSMVVNYALGQWLYQRPGYGRLVLGVGLNLATLGYFKYAGFLVDNVNALFDSQWQIGEIILPLAISFFTFQQIAYLVDCHRRETEEHCFTHYCLFVTFFPQLIAGPIVHHKQLLPQFLNHLTWRIRAEDLAIGSTLFILGLFKKVVLADSIAAYANPVFQQADAGVILHPLDAWGGALAYTLQLYFDFSGYADMALGAARLFGIRLPVNFHSPYQATSIIEFWRRWHITLSQFLRDYVYIALGGNRKGPARRHANLLLTMLLGGLWHGAGWNFVIWGGLHGLYLVINHLWGQFHKGAVSPGSLFSCSWRWLLTFLAVVVAWVFFRAQSLEGAYGLLLSLAGLTGWEQSVTLSPSVWQWVTALLAIALFFPNSQQFMGLVDGGPLRRLRWSAQGGWLAIFWVMLGYTLLQMTAVSEFLYFRF